MRDSNSQHAVLETAALPIELIPFYLALFCAIRGAPAFVTSGAPFFGVWCLAGGQGTQLMIFR